MAYYNMTSTGGHTMEALEDYLEPTASAVNLSQTTADKESKPSGCLTFIDFCPEYKRKTDSWFFQADYQTFSEVFKKINEWLSDNRKWQVKTAETLIYDSITGFGQRLPFYAAKNAKLNLRAVRLWLVPRSDPQISAQKIGCINVVPRIKITNKVTEMSKHIEEQNNFSIDKKFVQSTFLSSTPTYETLDDMLVRVNHLMKTKPINGRILNVETVAIPVESNCWSVDTESSFWSEDCQNNNSTVFILRIYFEYGTNHTEHLEIIDFVPRAQMWDTPLAVPNYETFSSLLTRSSQWLRDQEPGLRFLSCNTVEVSVDFGFNAQSLKMNINLGNNSIESRKMFYPLNTNIDKSKQSPDKFSLKFLRLAMARKQLPCPEPHFPFNHDSVILNCKIFVPTKIPNALGSNIPDYESISVSKRKIEAWLMTTGARILSAETNVISIPFSSSSIATSVDSCLKSNSGNVLSHYLTVYRIYLDGHYLEPPARLLPLGLDLDDQKKSNDSCSLM